MEFFSKLFQCCTARKRDNEAIKPDIFEESEVLNKPHINNQILIEESILINS